MAELTPIERVQRFFNREPVDKMPFFSGMGMVLLPAIKKLGYNFPSVHRNAERMARSAIESARMFNLDSVVVPFDMCWESEAEACSAMSAFDKAGDVGHNEPAIITQFDDAQHRLNCSEGVVCDFRSGG